MKKKAIMTLVQMFSPSLSVVPSFFVATMMTIAWLLVTSSSLSPLRIPHRHEGRKRDQQREKTDGEKENLGQKEHHGECPPSPSLSTPPSLSFFLPIILSPLMATATTLSLKRSPSPPQRVPHSYEVDGRRGGFSCFFFLTSLFLSSCLSFPR